MSDLEDDLQAEVVKMGKEIGIIVVKTLTGEQDENMVDFIALSGNTMQSRYISKYFM